MPRKLIRRYVPSPQWIHRQRSLGVITRLLHDPNLWHLNRRSVSGAAAVGLFAAWLPVPFQMLLAALAAVPLRVNLPVSVALVWISNPLTIPPMLYFAYRLGSMILGTPAAPMTFHFSAEWLASELGMIWPPLLIGCLVMALLCAALGYAVVRLLWRLHVLRHLRARAARLANRPPAGRAARSLRVADPAGAKRPRPANEPQA